MNPPEQSDPKIEFLMIEVEMGLTFASIALGATADAEKLGRNTVNARKAYDTILRFRGVVEMSPEQLEQLDAGLAELRQHLLFLGEDV